MSLWLTLAGTAAAVWMIIAVLPWQPHRTRERLGADAGPSDLAEVSVLIPARNEAEHIGGTLAALARQGSNLHVIVVDDRSEDGTAQIAAEFRDHGEAASLRVDVLSGKPLPKGWGGKLWALQQGLDAVDRPYCLLLDADIELAPHVVPALLRTARQSSSALVSVMATLRCRSVWERLLVPPFIFFFKLLYPFSLVARPTSWVAAAAGGCILVEKAALQRVDAFAAWSDALIDDCTLARHLKRAGYGLQLLMSHDVVSTRGYLRLAEFWQMVSRTAYTQLQYSVLLLLLTTAVMAIVFAVPVVTLFVFDSYLGPVLGALALVAMIADYGPVARFYNLPLLWRLTLPFAAVLFLAMTWHSAINYCSGTRATWKSRNYDSRS